MPTPHMTLFVYVHMWAHELLNSHVMHASTLSLPHGLRYFSALMYFNVDRYRFISSLIVILLTSSTSATYHDAGHNVSTCDVCTIHYQHHYWITDMATLMVHTVHVHQTYVLHVHMKHSSKCSGSHMYHMCPTSNC